MEKKVRFVLPAKDHKKRTLETKDETKRKTKGKTRKIIKSSKTEPLDKFSDERYQRNRIQTDSFIFSSKSLRSLKSSQISPIKLEREISLLNPLGDIRINLSGRDSVNFSDIDKSLMDDRRKENLKLFTQTGMIETKKSKLGMDTIGSHLGVTSNSNFSHFLRFLNRWQCIQRNSNNSHKNQKYKNDQRITNQRIILNQHESLSNENVLRFVLIK